jgi:hypothetical protein
VPLDSAFELSTADLNSMPLRARAWWMKLLNALNHALGFAH